MKIWIALSGKAGCGKSTIAKNLVKHHGFVRMAFAKRLKEISKELFPEIMKAPKEEHRKLLQLFGSFCRLLQPDCWIQIVVNQIHDLDRVVIDDVRFPNEFQVLRKLGFILVRIERSDDLRRPWGYNVNDPHPSETDLDLVESWDLVLPNDGKHPFDETSNVLLDRLKLPRIKVKES